MRCVTLLTILVACVAGGIVGARNKVLVVKPQEIPPACALGFFKCALCTRQIEA